MASNPPPTTNVPTPTWRWWELRWPVYNAALVAAAVLAYFCYFLVLDKYEQVLGEPIYRDGEYIGRHLKTDGFAVIFECCGFGFGMLAANILYFAGPLSEIIRRPGDVMRYRRRCWHLGLWSSCAVPFAIPLLLWLSALGGGDQAPPYQPYVVDDARGRVAEIDKSMNSISILQTQSVRRGGSFNWTAEEFIVYSDDMGIAGRVKRGTNQLWIKLLDGREAVFPLPPDFARVTMKPSMTYDDVLAHVASRYQEPGQGERLRAFLAVVPASSQPTTRGSEGESPRTTGAD
jgi:hypothetical protein